jgi:quercetin dioxygenase-like cupin family protein
MAIPHARPGEVIDVRPLADRLEGEKTRALVKTDGLEIIRLIVPRDKEIPPHATNGAITVQCLEGRVAFTAEGVRRELAAGEMLYLEGAQSHSIRGIDDASLLLTITFPCESTLEEGVAAVGANELSKQRGGRVDFDQVDASDNLDEALQESFPASDPPSYS